VQEQRWGWAALPVSRQPSDDGNRWKQSQTLMQQRIKEFVSSLISSNQSRFAQLVRRQLQNRLKIIVRELYRSIANKV
jgi:hypothetical protein